MKTTYIPNGVCSKAIDLEIQDGIITSLCFTGGCNGNLKGVSSLCIGRNAREVIKALAGTCCGSRATSCPDQLSKAIEDNLSKQKQ